jgi:hypothetical protein
LCGLLLPYALASSAIIAIRFSFRCDAWHLILNCFSPIQSGQRRRKYNGFGKSLARLEAAGPSESFIESLRRQGVEEETIASALAEARKAEA